MYNYAVLLMLSVGKCADAFERNISGKHYKFESFRFFKISNGARSNLAFWLLRDCRMDAIVMGDSVLPA